MRTPGFESLRVSQRHLKSFFRLVSPLIALFVFTAPPAAAQSPNTASMIVNVVDQAGAVVPDAKV